MSLQQVRFAYTFGLDLRVSQATGPFDVPASRAFRQVWSLRVAVDYKDPRPGCWDSVAQLLARGVTRWKDLQEVRLSSFSRDEDEGE